MKKSLEQLIYHSVSQHNILPLTSCCNMRCAFCSHQFNPPQLEVYNLPNLSWEQIEEMIQFLSPDKKIVLGESVTRIMEGEPLLSPHFWRSLSVMRKKLPLTPFQITTNGSLLSEENIRRLADFRPLEINFSLNSATERGRIILMQDKKVETSLAAAFWLQKYNIPFHGSIVAMPMLLGWEDLEETILFLHRHKAQTIRVFLPGYAQYNQPQWSFSLELWQELQGFLEKMSTKINTPLILEPMLLANLIPQIEGVIINSPADLAGLQRGDIIQEIEDKIPRTRVEAFYLIKKTANPRIIFSRQGNNANVVIKKERGDAGGLVFAYDLSLDTVEQWEEQIKRYNAQKILFCTSALAEKIVTEAIRLLPSEKGYRILKVENKFLGGSLLCAGLLTVEDLSASLCAYLKKSSWQPDLILLSALSFDPWGRDLLGKSYLNLKEKFDIPVELIYS